MNVRDLLIALVRNAIKSEVLDIDAIKESLSENKLATLFKVSKNHDVAHLVCYALEKNGFSFEGETWERFVSEKEQARLRYEMIQADINEICVCFEDEGIDYIPLKGAALRGLYPEPWMRTSCDIDILVREEDLKRAVKALVEKHSYKTDNKKTYHDISLYSPFGMHLELHYNIKENEPKYDELLTRVWEFSKKAQGFEHKYELTNEFLLLHLTAHAAYHFVNGGCGLRAVLDLWLLETSVELDWDIIIEALERNELAEFYGAIADLGEYWFGAKKEVREIVIETEKFILLGGLYGTEKQAATAKQVKKGGRLKYFWSRIFLPYESLSILYPIIKKHKIMTPFCQISRWFGAIFKSKRIVKETKNIACVGSQEIKKTKELLYYLGL